LEFPLDVKKVFRCVFGLQTHFVDLTHEAPVSEVPAHKVLGGLYPEKFFFQGKDKVILINTGYEALTTEFCRFVIAHVAGHYVLHFGHEEAYKSMELMKPNFALSRPTFCNLLDQHRPLEIQASHYASAILMPRGEIFRLSTSQKLLDLYGQTHVLCQRFGVSQQILELRLQQLEAELRHAGHTYPSYPMPVSTELLKF